MQGVVPAAGPGTRLRPHTLDQPKGLVPVAGRPLLSHCFESLLDLGVDELVVVIGYRGDQIVDRFGETFEGTPIRYAEQSEPAGLADAVLAAEPDIDADFVVLNGDNVYDADLLSLLERHRSTGAAATVLVDDLPPDEAAETAVLRFDDDGELADLVEKPDEPPSTSVTRGCAVFSPAIFHACHLVQPSRRGESELTDAVALLLHAGHRVETVPLDGRCVNVNTPDDLERADHLVG